MEEAQQRCQSQFEGLAVRRRWFDEWDGPGANDYRCQLAGTDFGSVLSPARLQEKE